MTRPAGVTPRGLPYPGSANIHADTPSALQALAEAITAQLGAVDSAIVFDYFVGTKTLDGYGSATVTFPNLAECLGCLVSWGSWGGGPDRIGTATGGPAGQFFVIAANQNVDALKENFNNTTVSVCAIGWGPPK